MIDILPMIASIAQHGADAAATGSNPIEKFGHVLQQMGVSGPKLLAQIILFLIVALVLKKFAFGPVQKILDERKDRIAKGLEQAKEIEANLVKTEAESRKRLEEANRQVEAMLAEAKNQADKLTEKKVQEAIAAAEAIVKKAHEATQLEREKMFSEIKGQIGQLVVQTSGKVIGRVLTQDDQKRLSDEALKQVAV